jgi:pyruvate/2-oxoglutarate dehydrogenase complex dihydrolipoamide acyltransferase (E2) component
MGTFAINGGVRLPIRPVTTTGAIGLTLYFGLFDAAGCTDVCLTFDHRVMDGGDVVRTLDALESVLNTDIRLELEALL